MNSRIEDIPEISVNPQTCQKCGMCTCICPLSVFNAEGKTIPFIRHQEECVLCGQCICACPSSSINHSGFHPEAFLPVINPKPLNSETAFQFLSQRRSVRNYKTDIPDQALLEKIIEIAGYAPSSPHHRIGWVRNAIVVTGNENMKIVNELTADYMKRTLRLLKGVMIRFAARFDDTAKAGIAVAPSFEMALNNYHSGKNSITYDAPAAIFLYAPMRSSMPQVDCDTACLQIQLYAETFGLGTCWNGLIQGAAAGDHLKNFSLLSDFLGIPERHKCYAAMTIGYPSVKLHKIPERKTSIRFINSK